MKIFLVLALLMFSLEAKSLFSNSEQKDKSKYIGALKDLMIATQKTRGLTNSYLNGNTAAQLLVYGNRNKMKKAIGQMESLPFAADPIINKRATTISQDLIKLNSKAFRKPAPEVFEAYTEAIAQTLMLAQSVSNRNADEMNPIGQDLTAVMMEDMLPLIEYIGQLRGLGSGLAAKGKVTPAQKDKLIGIMSQIVILLEEFQADMDAVTSKYANQFDGNINKKVKDVVKAVNEYMNFANTNFTKPKYKVDATAYFDRGTAIISKILEIYDINNAIIKTDAEGWI
jgi:hypothetical protein